MSVQLTLAAGKDQLTQGKSGMYFILLLLLFSLYVCLLSIIIIFGVGEFNFVCLCVLICLAFSVFVLFIYLFFNFCCHCCCFYVLFCFCFSIFGLSCSPLRHFHQSFISFSLKQLPVINTVSTFWQVTLVCQGLQVESWEMYLHSSARVKVGSPNPIGTCHPCLAQVSTDRFIV